MEKLEVKELTKNNITPNDLDDVFDEASPYPDLYEWVPEEEDIFYEFIGNDYVRARYEKLNLNPASDICVFIIKNKYFKDRMLDVLQHINYYTKFYDKNHELFMSMLSVKYIIDTRPDVSQKAFRHLVIDRIITDNFIKNVKQMARDLYALNINLDVDGKYKSSPKITNGQAREIVALSFAFRMVLPLLLHFVNISSTITEKRSYIPCFDRIYMKIIDRFECGYRTYDAIYEFIPYRVDRATASNKKAFAQKEQLYGHTDQTYLENIIHEILIVKGLYKLSYNRSVVSFLSGIFFNFNLNYLKEVYPYKPYEIDSEDVGESEDKASLIESLEMTIYSLDESNIMINEVNIAQTIEFIDRQFMKLVDDDELKFYEDNCKLNETTQFLLQSFYSPIFHDSFAVYSLSRYDTIKLLVYLKKYLQLRGMSILPQICTSRIQNKIKDTMIKNAKFLEKVEASSVYQHIIKTKYKYINELSAKDNIILRKMSALINSTFIFVDYDDDINGIVYKDTNINVDILVNEFLLFLSII